TRHGYILDCIDIQKQLAFDHPLLKNHSIQLKPTSIPKWTRDNDTSPKSSSLPFRQDDDDTSCPIGTFAIAEYYKENHGAMGSINIWDPSVKPDQLSLASISIENGLRDSLQSISAGCSPHQHYNKSNVQSSSLQQSLQQNKTKLQVIQKEQQTKPAGSPNIVSPKVNQNHSGLFTYWTADGDNKTGCYNTLCPGFVQVSSKFALGTLAKPVSTYNGEQYILRVIIFQDNITGNWWFLLRGKPIGYWPRSLFNGEGIAYGASRVFWGGEVYSAVRQRTSPIMGNGHFPQEGYKKAAFVNGLKVIDHVSEKKNTSPPASNMVIFANSPRASDLVLFSNSPTCYKVETRSGVGEYWSSAIFFGGPGGCTIT
ncbi:hypothetical protein CARUB_v10015776mg, partial [Capsella rubella]